MTVWLHPTPSYQHLLHRQMMRMLIAAAGIVFGLTTAGTMTDSAALANIPEPLKKLPAYAMQQLDPSSNKFMLAVCY